MARKPNYSYERFERERAKTAKRQAKAEAKAAAKATPARAPGEDGAGDETVERTAGVEREA
jgi:hypothetical protein